MATYSSERKAEVLKRLEDTERLTISQLAKEEGIRKSTLQGWVKQAEKGKKAKYLERWRGRYTRNWEIGDAVYLYPFPLMNEKRLLSNLDNYLGIYRLSK